MSSCTEFAGSDSLETNPIRVGVRRARRGFVRRLLADTRGTATTETVIMIPMFAIVWGCIFFVFTFFQRTITMRSLTRGHTWAYSYVGCSGSGPGTQLGTGSGGTVGGGGTGDGDVDSIVQTMFGLRTGHGTRRSTVARPRVLGTGSLNITDTTYVMCNDVPRGVMDYTAQFIGRLLNL